MTPNQIKLFWEKVNKTESCWLWTASVGWNGYGMFGRPTRRAHIIAIELAGVTLESGQLGLHKCNTPRCVRYHPEHVYVGDTAQNALDRWQSTTPEQLASFKNSVSLVTRGSLNGEARLTEHHVIEIRKRYQEGLVGRLRRSRVSVYMLAAEYDVSPSQIKRIVNRQSWRHV